MTDINETLAGRENNYGSFFSHAEISQGIKMAMKTSPNWFSLSTEKKESLEMIAHKIARILNGNPNLHDSWHDIAGYATLVANEIKRYEQS